MTAEATEDPEYDADEDLAMSPEAGAWRAEQVWCAQREEIYARGYKTLEIAGSIAGAMAGSYPPGANTALAQDALDIAAKLIEESAARTQRAVDAWEAANPRPEPADAGEPADD